MSSSLSTLLHLCAFRGNVNILKHLLDNGLDVFAQNKHGDSCLHIAIRRGNTEYIYELVRWCVLKGITAQQAEVENSLEKLTPYMTAVLREKFDIANLLIKNNLATKGYINRDGRSLRQIAEHANRQRALAYIDN